MRASVRRLEPTVPPARSSSLGPAHCQGTAAPAHPALLQTPLPRSCPPLPFKDCALDLGTWTGPNSAERT